MKTIPHLPPSLQSRQTLTQKEAQGLFLNSYKCRQLYTLLDTGRAPRELNWLSERLDLPTADVAVFLEVLFTLGLARVTSEGFLSTEPFSSSEGAITQIRPREHAALTYDLLGDLPGHGSESLFFCVATDEDGRKHFIQQFKDLVQSFCERSKSSSKSLIYSVSLTTTKIRGEMP